MKRIILTMISIAFMTFLIGCADSDESNNQETANEQQEKNNEDEDENHNTGEGNDNQDTNSDLDEAASQGDGELYHAIGETFEFDVELLSNSSLEITVHDIWMEDGEDHWDYIEDNVASPEGNETVTFISFTVSNIGDEAIYYSDVLPMYYGEDASNDEIDISYPENDEVETYVDSFQLSLEPGETEEMTGAKVTTPYSENGGAFIWNFMADQPEVVFQTPQSERNDKFGVYDLGEEIYVIDRTEDHQLIATVESIEVEEEAEFDSSLDNAVWLLIKMKMENAGNEKQEITRAYPSIIVDDEIPPHSPNLIFNGEFIEDPYNTIDSHIESGETVDVELFIEVEKAIAEDAQVHFVDEQMLTHPMKINPGYSRIVNYNLD